VFFRPIQQLLQLLVTVPVTISRPPVKSRIAETTGHGPLVKWVNAVHEAQLLAKLPHFFSLPFAARLPDARDLLRATRGKQLRLDLAEEVAEIGFVRRRGSETGWTLERGRNDCPACAHIPEYVAKRT
jgi:hypothetical protein